MAVADAVLPSPPPPRIVVAVLALVRFVLDPLPALGRALPVVAGVLRYLCFTVAWILSAAEAAKVVAHRAWGEGSASFLFLKTLTDWAFLVLACSSLVSLALAALLLCVLCVAYTMAVLSGSGSEFKKVSCKLTQSSNMYSGRITTLVDQMSSSSTSVPFEFITSSA
ncbi:uncharacterized protein LOC119357627 [Triticum dicoccoides]|uniref:uncharacterized protein LOC119357627 n=1 Tax=Triticum dicoccoides TaxID=85692 RepID=UPI00188E8044|nr:uncharacterized protein LOC119357627 [Triticum dicoccoides]